MRIGQIVTSDIGHHGYATPKRCVEALLRHLTDITAPILDIGCGTAFLDLHLKMLAFPNRWYRCVCNNVIRPVCVKAFTKHCN